MTKKDIEVNVPAGHREVESSSSSAGGFIEGSLWLLSVFLCCITCPFSLFYMFRQVKVKGASDLQTMIV